jgi:hypothetical protein
MARSRLVSGTLLGCARRLFLAAFTSALGACSSLPAATDLMPQAPKFEFKTLPPARPIRALGAPSLIGPDGSCSAAPGPSEFIGAGIALDMSECDVVQRAGPPDSVDVSANARGERAVVLTYLRGERPGIYRFASGRLVSIERAAEPPAPERPTKKKPSPKARSG